MTSIPPDAWAVEVMVASPPARIEVSSMNPSDRRIRDAMAGLDAANAGDPVLEPSGSDRVPRALLYSRRMTACLGALAPEASEALKLAVRAQHLKRWTVPRSDYPAGRAGYHRWRTDLGAAHARWCGEILSGAGYTQAEVARVQSLIRKEHRSTDPECQLLEDTACLVFLQHYLDDFARDHERAKVVQVLRRTWRKMGDRGRSAATALNLTPAAAGLVTEMLASREPADA